MSLPKKAEKAYLEIEPSPEGFFITAKKSDADALAALFLQYGIDCRREQDVDADMDLLHFIRGLNREEVERILMTYVTTKGS